MKRLILLLAALAAMPAFAAEKLVVAATAVPHAEILEFIKPRLAAEGVDISIKVFTDYVQPNVQVAEKRIDVSYFETGPYLDEFNKGRGTNLVRVAGVHIEPLGAYSTKFKTLAELPDGASVAIPNEASNGGRALLLLQKAGLITLKDPANPVSSLRDIATNPKHLKFRELEGAMLPRVLNQVDLAVINTNYALDARLDPTRDALAIEDGKSPYVNFLVGRPDNRDAPAVKKLAAALTSPEVKEFIAKKYKGAVIPAF
ncbi:MAG: MetQ/NlpA family ABC transporter substrate-binding protein [Proteobacteria bacterium]|uniref:MetQ/NlpA family ABC transporter substrate-binding protein n=1 Tax=Rudaea sp. TaxID=2136325 RepID=UPI00321FF0AF|nr:MetQ/NlpA family ABC transporter substrate-binding protein [Pseudomonadota bacterium]